MISRGNVLRIFSYIFSFFFVFSFLFSSPATVVGYHQSEIDRLRAQQEELRQQQEQNQGLLEEKEQEADTLEHTIRHLNEDITFTNNRIENTQDQISITNQLITALNGSIEENTKVLVALNEKLKNAYITLYELSQTSTIELILQSNSLEEIISQTQYIQAVQTDLSNDISDANSIRKDLEQKKTAADNEKQDLTSLNTQLSESKNSLSAQRTQKDDLLEQTEGDQAKYEQLLADIRSRNAEVEAQIIAIINNLYNSGIGPGEGQPVVRGTPVGVQGSTGFSSGAHVHFEVREGNIPRDPRGYVSSGVLSWPLKSFRVTQEFGENWQYKNRNGEWVWAYGPAGHTGRDIVAIGDRTVYAPADGVVVLDRCFGDYGRAWVEVTNSGQWVLMGHMQGNC